MTTIIIGAGASGLACAIRLKQNNPNNNVIILERLPQVGKKILASGNGRCNLSNTNAKGHERVVEFFDSIGLVTRVQDEGRIYPYSNQAATVVDVLFDSATKLGAEILTSCNVSEVTRDLRVITDKGEFKGDNVVVATGGKAQSALGSNASGYEILKALGHTITPLCPALVQLTSPSKHTRALNGQRVKCKMSILIDNVAVKSEYGEVLFTNYGLSGIVSMNLSHIVSENFASANPRYCHAVLDLIPDMSEAELSEYISKYKSLTGILGKRLSDIIENQAQADCEKMVKLSKNWKLIINGTKGFDFAQITWGGADLKEFDGCRSKLVEGLYICGEIMDRQFECGGYNLNHAWLSGIEVADSI